MPDSTIALPDSTGLEKLKSDWEGLAERDALWAILTDANKAGGKWDLDEFLATGESEIQTVLDHLARISRAPRFNGAALDFGCGVGRLTQALGRRFASCTGIDISQHMIEKARTLNHSPNCSYITGAAFALPFIDASFTFVYSNIVLQHMLPEYAQAYLREFVRVLVPGGVLVFGVQDAFRVRNLNSFSIRLRQRLRLRSRIRETFGHSAPDMQMHCLPEPLIRRAIGAAKIVDIQFTNTAEKDFNGRLFYRALPPATGYASRQYCVIKNA
jgi:SAM-dependent methyltransferase